MEIKSGERLRSQVDATEIIVVRALPGDVDLRCGGAALIPIDATAEAGVDVVATLPRGGGPVLGKRYTDSAGGLEVLATKAGSYALTVGDSPLTLKDVKPLPSSD